MSKDSQLNLFGESSISPPTPPIPSSGKIPIPPGTYQSIGELAADCGVCMRCELGKGRINPVVGRGNEYAPIMVIGEGPGENEDRSGLPFVGRSGQLLEKIFASVNLSTEKDVYNCVCPFFTPLIYFAIAFEQLVVQNG